MWLQLGGRDLRSKEEQLGRYLVGQWKEEAAPFLDLALLRRWGGASLEFEGESELFEFGQWPLSSRI